MGLFGTKRALFLSPIRWLLRDSFMYNRAAGTINNTAAEPGPGIRTEGGDAVNTITNDNYVWAQWTTARNWLAESIAIPCVAGRVALFRMALFNNNQFAFGLDPTIAPPPAPAAPGLGSLQVRVQGYGSSVRFLVNAAYNINMAVVYPNNTNFQQFALVVGTGQAYLFVKFDTDTFWYLRMIRPGVIGATLYAYWTNFTTTVSDSDGQLDYIRVPETLYLPTPLTYDTFTRADGAIGSTELLGPENQPTVARTWVDQVGTTQISANTAKASALVGGLAIATVNTSTADVFLQATLTRAGGSVGAVLRYQDTNNYVYVIHDGTNCQLISRIAGVEAVVITAVVALGAGAVIVVCQGTSYMLYLNGTQVGATSVIAGLTTGTIQGLYSTNTGNTQDNFLVMPRGSNSEYEILERLAR